MGCCASEPLSPTEREDMANNKAVTKYAKSIQEKENRMLKILLLGPGESGKSTIFKQMHLLYGSGGFNDAVRHNFKQVIRKNVVEWMQSLIKAAERFKLPFESKEEQYAVEYVKKLEAMGLPELTTDLCKQLLVLWGPNLEIGGSASIKRAYLNRFKIYFELGDSGDSLIYFFERIEKIFSSDYVPNDQDILRARLKTASILESVFSIGKFDFKFIDVGGQRNERRKWVHCFDGVTSILFVVAISAYDQTLYEDARVNRMNEALDVWEEIVHNPNFLKTPIILFLNKHDLFKEKIQKVDLTIWDKDYQGPRSDAEAAQEYIKQKFIERRGDNGTEFFCHYTNATDTKNIETVWKDCRNIILVRSLQGSGMAAEFD